MLAKATVAAISGALSVRPALPYGRMERLRRLGVRQFAWRHRRARNLMDSQGGPAVVARAWRAPFRRRASCRSRTSTASGCAIQDRTFLLTPGTIADRASAFHGRPRRRVLYFASTRPSPGDAEEFVADRLATERRRRGRQGEDLLSPGAAAAMSRFSNAWGPHGLSVDAVAPFERRWQPVSSSRIREALEGRCETATRLLTRPFAIEAWSAATRAGGRSAIPANLAIGSTCGHASARCGARTTRRQATVDGGRNLGVRPI